MSVHVHDTPTTETISMYAVTRKTFITSLIQTCPHKVLVLRGVICAIGDFQRDVVA